MTRLLFVLIFIMTAVSCSYVPKLDNILPDKRTEYKKSESLPDLEVPPDLTAEAINDSMSIPNEGASLSEYQKRRSGGGTSSQAAPVTAAADSDEQWISVIGNNENIWPRLRNFISEQGYSLDLDDAELGVLETTWSEAYVEDGFSYRDKFKIFSEPGADPGLTVLFVSNQRQVLATRQDGTDSWSDKEKSRDAEKKLAGDLNLLFNGNREAIVSSTAGVGGAQQSTSPRKKTLVETTGDGKDYLAIPEEYTRAWRHTEIALQRAGLPIASKDQGSGIYNITYFDSTGDKEKGWLSKLKFWGGDEAPEGVPFQLSLTGVGDKTELIVLDQAGEWATSNDALQIMAIIQSHLNKL
ncbi:MAG: outer membrane protein assembly factor BamC [Gammaproteobacteria bacterium]|jgi:outer membrane protein assembly factor BamC|nr:outer membrane protein assembly factor BamC [Gammaproteobacteria bacterium]